jgi:hypothetical protein
MARFLAVGNLAIRNLSLFGVWEHTTDMSIFFDNPDVEFLNVGPGPDVFDRQKRPVRAIVQDALNGAYELVFAGNNDFPYFNPRKNWAKNLSNLAWKVLRHPNLLNGGRFPYSKVGTRLVGIDMDDRPIVDNRWFHIVDNSLCFFKRELPQNTCNAFLYTTAKTECNGNVLHSPEFRQRVKKLRPISLGVDPETCRQFSTLNSPKKTDVFFAGDTTNRPNRIAGLKQLEHLKQEGWIIDIPQNKMQRSDFLQRCAQAHIVWSPEGYGWDCNRHYEIAMVGSVPLMQSPTIRRYAPLNDGEHALYYYVEGDHLAARIRQALSNRGRLIEMGQAARRHVLQSHTNEAIGRYVIEETRRTLAQASEPND